MIEEMSNALTSYRNHHTATSCQPAKFVRQPAVHEISHGIKLNMHTFITMQMSN